LDRIGTGYGDAEWPERELKEAGNARVGCGFITGSLARKPELLRAALRHSLAAII
jgi:nitronate monooxygenase